MQQKIKAWLFDKLRVLLKSLTIDHFAPTQQSTDHSLNDPPTDHYQLSLTQKTILQICSVLSNFSKLSLSVSIDTP